MTPRFADPAWVVWEDSERCTLLATIGNRLYVAYCHGQTSKGTLKQLDLNATYEARWFDPQKGVYAGDAMKVRATNGEWAVPEKPTVEDWALILQRT